MNLIAPSSLVRRVNRTGRTRTFIRHPVGDGNQMSELSPPSRHSPTKKSSCTTTPVERHGGCHNAAVPSVPSSVELCVPADVDTAQILEAVGRRFDVAAPASSAVDRVYFDTF